MKKAVILTSILILVALPVLVFAAQPPEISPLPGEKTTIEKVLTNIMNWIIGITGVIAAIFLIIGGILYMTAGGDPNKIGAAKTTLTSAIIGVVIILLTFIIITLIRTIVTRP